MLTFEQALAILRTGANPLGNERVPLAEAGSRILAQPVTARIDMPRYDAAAMDGYALAGEIPTTGLPVEGAIYPGSSGGQLPAGKAVRVMTGAAVPAGADRVLPIELVEEVAGIVRPIASPPRRSHIRARGSDMAAGREILPAGMMLTPRALVTAAGADVGTLTCWRRPVVSVIASGDELAAPGTAQDRVDAVPDSLSQAVLLLAQQWGAKPRDAALVPDDVAAIRSAAEAALGSSDILVLAGGASRGDRDFAKSALAPLGLDIQFADIAMKPGKPAWYGRIGPARVIGLPGNPTAAMTVARLLLAPLICAIGGRDMESALRWRDVQLAIGIDGPAARERFLCARDDGAEVTIIERQTASDQARLAQADLLVRIRPDTCPSAGSFVTCLDF